MKIIYEKTQYYRFAFVFEYSTSAVNYCRFLKSSYGWKNFTFYQDKWRFNDPTIVFLLKMQFPTITIDPQAQEIISFEDRKCKEDLDVANKAKEIKDKTDSNIVIPGIKGHLYPYQKVGVEFFMNNKGRAILSDQMGTGKTAQTLGYVLKANHKRTLVVCPASVKYSWEAEVKKWTKLKSFVVTPDTDFYHIPTEANIVITNYDILKKFEADISRLHWDCLVLDESQMIKSPTAIRTKTVKRISRGIKSVIMLSGTPLLSRPIELFTMLNIIDPVTWNNYYEYAGRYCDGHRGKWGYEAKGATNLAELTERISRYFLRRTKDQVLKDLPPKNRVTLPVDLPAQARKDYNKASKEFIKFLKENKKKKDKEVARTLNAESLTKINYLREIAVMGRLDNAKEIIDSIIDAGEKVLVFSSFNAPLDELADEYFDKAVKIDGRVDVEERGEIVKKFQTDPNVQVFLGGYLSAGTGITLTAASNVIFLDYPWRPADALQAEDRLHRPGQTASSVNIYQLHSRGTIDDFMVKLLEKKQRIFDVVVESQKSGEKDEKMVDELIKMLEEEN